MSYWQSQEVLASPETQEMQNVVAIRPQDEDVFISAEQAREQALAALPPYEVQVERRTAHKEPESTRYGTIYQEAVRYSDGAVRLATIGIPNDRLFGQEGSSPYPIISSDPWLTGPSGLNKDKIEQFVERGFPVIWNHHQGRHSLWPPSVERLKTVKHFLQTKSVGRSAHHDHALLDSLEAGASFHTDEAIREGYSRSAMSGQAYVSLDEGYDRKTHWIDVDAPCFAHKSSRPEMMKTFLAQAPHEARALGTLAINLVKEEVPSGRFNRLPGYAGTFDPNWLNLLHEIAWVRPLINGDAGVYAEAMPLNTTGIITLFEHDYMSHQADWHLMHAVRPNLVVSDQEGAHLTGASTEHLAGKYQRFENLMTYMRAHGMSLTGLALEDVIPNAPATQEAA